MESVLMQAEDARLELLGRLGRGGMAQIHLARQRGAAGFSRLVAVKRARRDLEAGEEVGRALRHEARIMAMLRHPNVVQVHDFIDLDGDGYLVMEAVDGVSVAQLIRRLGRLPAPAAAHLAACVALGLHAAHELIDPNGCGLGVVHRDVSPDNILLDWSGQVKVSDFGIALVTTQGRVTEPGMVKGKFSYMAPEQLQHRQLDRRSDVYSLGAVLYEMLTGRAPFAESVTEGALLYSIMHAAPPPLPGTIPPALATLVLQCLNKNPAARVPSAIILAQRLRECAGSSDAVAIKVLLDRAYPSGDAQRTLFSSLVDRDPRSAQEGTRKLRKVQLESSGKPSIRPAPRVRSWAGPLIGWLALLGLSVFAGYQVDRHGQAPARAGKPGAVAPSFDRTEPLRAEEPAPPPPSAPSAETPQPPEVPAQPVLDAPRRKAAALGPRHARARKKAAAVAGAAITMSGPVNCKVSVNARAVGWLATRPTVRLNPGVHHVLCEGGPNKLSLRRTVMLRKNEKLKLELRPATGVLLVKVSPWGNVYLDGQDLGMSPVQPVIVSEGRHVVEAVHHPSGQRVRNEVVVAPGNTETVRLKLQSY